MGKMTRKQAINEYVKNMGVQDLRSIVYDVNCYDGQLDWLIWRDMDCLDEVLSGCAPTEIAQRIYYGGFRVCDEYFQFNGYGNLESCNGYDWDKQLDEYRDDIADALTNFAGDVSDPILQNLVDSPDDSVFDEDYERID